MKQFTKTTHTPSPWVVSTKNEFKHTSDDYHQIVALEGPRTNAPGFTITGCIDIHDAQLIASAPDLLREIEQLIMHAEEGTLDYSVLEHARKLVFKTTHPKEYAETFSK